MADKIDRLLETIAKADVAELMSLWRTFEGDERAHSAEITRAIAERILAHGEPLLAYDVIRSGLAVWPSDLRLRQLNGLALARSGATERANALLEKLSAEGEADEETLGMLGRTYKDLAAAAGSSDARTDFLKRAASTYARAYEKTGGYWTGINAATMALLSDEVEHAGKIASRVREECLKRIQKPDGDSYWELAVLGEAALILRDLKQASEWYERAGELGKNRYGDLNSSRQNARLILRHWKEDPDWIDNYLRIPTIIIFAGHMIDRPGRETPRFPPELEPTVAREIREKIDKAKPGFGFASAACGSDILFLEAMLERGAEVSVVLPYNEEQFVRDSVDFLPGSNWRSRFNQVRDRAARVITASNQRLEIGGISYEFCNDLILGFGTLCARRLNTKLVPLVVWNGTAGDGPGGAASAVSDWRTLGYEPEIVKVPSKNMLDAGTQKFEQEGSELPKDFGFGSRIVAILFADAVGFSKLTEPEVPRFMRYFLGPIAELSEQFRDTMIAKNSWGDGLYFVFSHVDAAGVFALKLADFAATTDWEKKGLRPGMSLRIALHAGPVYEFDDPITGQRSYTGTHVSRAARMEPITPPGHVYASEAFAALAAGQHVREFSCDYVGQTPMAKGYGTLPMYHVVPSHS